MNYCPECHDYYCHCTCSKRKKPKRELDFIKLILPQLLDRNIRKIHVAKAVGGMTVEFEDGSQEFFHFTKITEYEIK